MRSALDRVNAIGWSNGATSLILLASERPEFFSTAIFLHGNASFLPEDAEAMGARSPELFEAFGEAEFSWEHARFPQKEWPSADFRDELLEVRARSLVIAGSHDMLPIDKAEEIADGILDAALVVFEDSGHFAPLEKPEKFLKTILEFLDNDVSPAEDGG